MARSSKLAAQRLEELEARIAVLEGMLTKQRASFKRTRTVLIDGAELLRVRLLANWSQADVGRGMGVTKSAVYAWEKNGVVDPEIATGLRSLFKQYGAEPPKRRAAAVESKACPSTPPDRSSKTSTTS